MFYFISFQTIILYGDYPTLWDSVYLFAYWRVFSYILLSGLYPVDRGWCRRSIAYEEQSQTIAVQIEHFKVKKYDFENQLDKMSCFILFYFIQNGPFITLN